MTFNENHQTVSALLGKVGYYFNVTPHPELESTPMWILNFDTAETGKAQVHAWVEMMFFRVMAPVFNTPGEEFDGDVDPTRMLNLNMTLGTVKACIDANGVPLISGEVLMEQLSAKAISVLLNSTLMAVGKVRVIAGTKDDFDIMTSLAGTYVELVTETEADAEPDAKP